MFEGVATTGVGSFVATAPISTISTIQTTPVICSLGSGSTVVISSPSASLLTLSASHSAMGGMMSEVVRSSHRPSPSSVMDNYR